MLLFYSRAHWARCAALLLAPMGAALAQGPVITAVIPMANARAAARNGAVMVSFSQPLTAASAGALKVFSSQRGGLRTRGATPAVVSGSALSFAPTAYDFRPGETVQYTVTTAAGSGGALAQARVGQFTAAAGGTGGGAFLAGVDVPVVRAPYSVVAGDLDGDGDLDFLTSNYSSGNVNAYLNNGSGLLYAYGGGSSVAVGVNPEGMVLGDVDGDGDLDLLVANYNGGILGTVSVRLNNGNGAFSGNQEVAVLHSPNGVLLGDVDGDGDLDLLVAQDGSGTVSIRLNDGNGNFSINRDASVFGRGPGSIAIGDVDGDGDLDLLATDITTTTGTVSIRLNNGSGAFSGSQNMPVGTNPASIVAGDVDGDGDLDFLTSNNNNRGASTISVRLNDGSGTFSGSQDIAVGTSLRSIALADVDSDGNLDIVAANEIASGAVSVRPNDGSGHFNGGQDVAVGISSASVAVGDADGDGDLDLFAANFQSSTVSIRLNGGTGPLATSPGLATTALTLFPNPAHGAATLSGATPNAPLAVLDALGRVLLTATADATGTARLARPEGLPAGVYVVRSGGQMRRLVVE